MTRKARSTSLRPGEGISFNWKTSPGNGAPWARALLQLLFVHHGDRVVEGRGGTGFQHRTDVTTAVMAAVGMGGGEAWVEVDRSEREALIFDAVKLALDLGVDVNRANADGRTALDAARTLKYDAVARVLVEKGARSGTK